ncbi:MAG: hypothetical protein AAFQ36_01975 [Pseudomonadota bacterium]
MSDTNRKGKPMSAATVRVSLRWFHIVGGLLVGTYLYSPWSANEAFTAITLYAVVPALGLSGLAMWKQGRLMRLISRRG